MDNQTVQRGLYLERLLIAFSSGIFLILPLYFKNNHYNEIFFAKIYAIGAISTIFCVSFSAVMLNKFGLKKLASIGSLIYTIGCLIYWLADFYSQNIYIYYIASLLHGGGWGLVFTLGPICLSTTVNDKNRSYYFTIYAAYSTLGVGTAPIICKFLVNNLHYTYQNLFILASITGGTAFLVSKTISKLSASYEIVNKNKNSSGLSDLKLVLNQKSIYFFIMVFFGACVYTSMINLQTTFAQAQNIDYTIFYFFYSLAVVLSRFFLSKPLSKIIPKKAIYLLMIMMIISLSFIMFASQSLILYSLGSLLLGISYGLVYPIIQAQATNHAIESLRPQTLVYFSLSYFIAVYLFPYAGASLAVKYGYKYLIICLIATAVMELLTAIYFYTFKDTRK